MNAPQRFYSATPPWRLRSLAVSTLRRILLAILGYAFLMNWAAIAQTLDASLDNGNVKVGVSRNYGGTIVWLSTSGGINLVNNADKGRQIQQSYYAGHSITGPNQCSNWSPWPWNPIIANVFYRAGIIEQWGKGTQKIID